MTLVLAAHGTRDSRGPDAVRRIAEGLRRRLPGVPVRVAYADVRRPDVTAVLRALRGPAVVVPAFLASGYHVRTDIPAQIAASGSTRVALADPLGPAPALLDALHDRLVQAGWRDGDEVVLAAAGSSDPRALAEVRGAAARLGARTGGRVRVGYLATADPSLVDVVAGARRTGRRVAVASWLLAPGLFHGALAGTGAEVIADPIGPHPRLVDTLAHRYLAASETVSNGVRPPGAAAHPAIRWGSARHCRAG